MKARRVRIRETTSGKRCGIQIFEITRDPVTRRLKRKNMGFRTLYGITAKDAEAAIDEIDKALVQAASS